MTNPLQSETLPVVVCDDSSMARKQLQRSLPQDWNVDISFATNGLEAMELIRSHANCLLFLDLNMPHMDGYQALELIAAEGLATQVIVVSGDIQPEAHARVTGMGALAFIEKPVMADNLAELLQDLGFYQNTGHAAPNAETRDLPALGNTPTVDLLDSLQEVANVAMGRSADLLARLLNAFIQLPIPKVNLLNSADLKMALTMTEAGATYSAVCQGFIGSGVAGEALVIFDDTSFADVAHLLSWEGEISKADELELLMDMASLLAGACINGIGDQLDINFSQGHPMVLGQHVAIGDLVSESVHQWNEILAVEITYHIENHDINCDLLLLFTEDSIEALKQRFAVLFS